MRIALALEYAGPGFCGFQSQRNGCGVQDALEHALEEIAGHPVSVSAAGRTDTGVHAVSQICHFDTEAIRPLGAWVRGVNTHLPRTAAVLWAQPVSPVFHARFVATARHYTYMLLNRPQRPGVLAGRAGWYHQPLDVGAMQRAAELLVGTHDFTSFRAAECQAKSPVKTMSGIVVRRSGPLVRFDFAANAFVHHMIRNIVGTLVYVGAERQPCEWVASVLAARDRARAAPTFAADGLYFAGAEYDAQYGLPPTVRDVALWP